MKIEHRDDLREVYLYAFDAFATNPSEVAGLHSSWNTRYARELLGVLQHAGLLVLTEDGEGSEAWQADPTSDQITHDEAEAKFDEWAGVPPDPSNATSTSARASSATSASREPHDCLCGCGEVITTRALYRPGHDARHAGVVGRQIAEIMNGGHDEGDDAKISDLYNALPSVNLIAKAKRIADNANQKNLKSAKPEPTCIEGIVTVNKQERLARRWSGGTVEYMLPGKADWKPASKAAAKTFQEG